MRHLLTAASWMTVLPVPDRCTPTPFTRADAAKVITWVPIAGAVAGAMVTALAWISWQAGLPAVLIGAVAIGGAVLLTRGMHMDGFADCVDALGSYGSAARAREIMRQGTAGPFAAAALALVLVSEAAAVGFLATAGHWFAIGVAVATSRVAAVIGCRRGWSPSNPDGFGALTAGTQPLWHQLGWATVAVGAAMWAIPSSAWQGPVAVAAGLALATVLMRHCVRRFDGLSGDVLGFGIEVATVVSLVLLCIH